MCNPSAMFPVGDWVSDGVIVIYSVVKYLPGVPELLLERLFPRVSLKYVGAVFVRSLQQDHLLLFDRP